MKRMSSQAVIGFAFLVVTLCLVVPGRSSAFEPGLGNVFPLSCTSGAGKAFFDIDTTQLDAESLMFVLGGVKVTWDELLEEGITPDFIVSFRGLNTGILNRNVVSPDIQGLVSLLDQDGVRFEVCSKAIDMSGEDPEEVMTEFTVIKNAWISSILNQNKRKGYAYVTF